MFKMNNPAIQESICRLLTRLPSYSLCLALVFGAFISLSTVYAQSVSPDMLEALKNRAGSGAGSRTTGSPLDQARERGLGQDQGGYIDPSFMQPKGPSRLEKDYYQRSGAELEQFGYDIFSYSSPSRAMITGRVPDRYVMGVGDELVVTFQGQNPDTITTYVDREGKVILPGLRPINVAGRTFGEFRRELEDVTKSALIGTDVYASVGSVRMISVYVLGEVNKPGLYNMTSLTTALEALSAAYGVKKTGSLRQIRIEREGKSVPVDIYAVLNGGQVDELMLHDGDRIIIPAVGPTVAVTGDVVRPGIYELNTNANTRLGGLIDMAGGSLRPRGYAYILNRFDEAGRQQVHVAESKKTTISDGDILTVSLRQNGRVGSVELVGAVAASGMRSLEEARTVRDLLGDVHNLGDTPYMLFGAIETTDPLTRARKLTAFSPERVLRGVENITLGNNDKVIIFDRRDIEFLSSDDLRSVVLTGQVPETYVAGMLPEDEELLRCRPLEEVASIVNDSQSGRFSSVLRAIYIQREQSTAVMRANAQREAGKTAALLQSKRKTEAAQEKAELDAQAKGAILPPSVTRGDEADYDPADDEQRAREICPAVYDEARNLLPFTLEYVVSATGALRLPGVYPVADRESLSSLMSIAGGTTFDADLSNLELMMYEHEAREGESSLRQSMMDARNLDMANIFVVPGSAVRVNTLYSDQEPGGVQISGEVRWPGVYTIRKGETLSGLIDRAGGLTNQAYPYGAVFTRNRIRAEQREGLQRMARDLDSALATAMLAKRDMSADVLMAAQELSKKMVSAPVAGRIVTEADPDRLAANPELDTVLEAGDRLYIPQRPSHILLIGDVLNPGALQFVSGKDARSYIQEAGGIQSTADKGRVFVVYPNGVAKPVRISSWTGVSDVPIPPGSSIVVPKDATPFDTITLVKDLSQILSQLAISAASIAVISR